MAACPHVDGCVAKGCVELSDGLYAVPCGNGVAVVERVAGEWPEKVAEVKCGARWGEVKRFAERLVEKFGACDDFEAYDACALEESGRWAEAILEMLERICR